MDLRLGDKARCTLTGTEGIIVAITYWLYGCVRATIQPHGTKVDGSLFETSTVDIQQLEMISRSNSLHSKESGGERNDKAALQR